MGWIGIAEAVAIVASVVGVSLAVLVVRERRVRHRFQTLADIASISEAGGTLEQTLDAICATLVPDFADLCMIDVIDEDRVPHRVAVRVAPGRRPELELGLAERKPSMPEWMVDDDSRSLQPRFFERMSEEDLRELSHDPEDLEFLRSLGVRSAITVALRARGEVTGMLTVAVAWSGRRYRREDMRFAWILSGRVALALDNSGLFADLERAERARAEIAETLQRGLLPQPLPHIPGWSIAAMYQPAGAENEVGGDFYDVFRVSGGWMLVIGDVTGRGARAASITAVARYTLRTAALLTNDPLAALAALNRALLARGDPALCSIAAIALSEDPSEPVRVAVAGHPPPLLVSGESVTEAAGTDPVLGAFADAEWTIEQSAIELGQQLVIVTDGITDSQGPEGRFGEDRLRAELRGTANPATALQRLEASLNVFTGGALDDDVAVLAIARASAEAPAGELETGDPQMALIERLYDGFNRRDEACIVALCDEGMELFPIVTAKAVGREAPYVGPAGLHDYMADVAQAWEELQISPGELQRHGDTLLVRGRVYARSRELGIRNMPVAWIWQLRDDRFVRGEVFPDPEQAVARFAAALAQREGQLDV